MIGFFIKKAFFDAWDNLIGLVLSNLGYLVVVMLFTLGMQYLSGSTLLFFFVIIIAMILFSFHSVGIANITKNYSDYKRLGFEGYKEGIKLFTSHAWFYALINIVMLSLAFLVMPFYLTMGNTIGFILGIITFWMLLTLILAMQFYLPLMSRFTGDKPFKTFKKCFIISIGNLSTTIFLLIFNIIQLALTVLTAGLLFSMTGITLASQDAFKLLLLKLDWLDENPEEDYKHVDWEDILFEERENVGHRSIKNMIFPWRD